MSDDQMRASWRNRELTQLSDKEAAYITEENIEPGYNDYSSRTVLHAFRAGMAAGKAAGGTR